ncbi:GINS complex, Psf2 component [Acaromyces ingoldii]|uniref:DNA replication complex GINS protein PSF2 n=1 Tax=Acaromyces ingoldii TaxID=215250 RepID=A0A316YSY2_9BASI|nr:GINS complex, Psf2 component [Acaromyces ingoldii]PWN92341.1 GINS complex, Psf2 component [Acaromyces ingoldii]
MALPSQLQPGLLPSEVEFLATSTEHVHVVPLVRIDRVRLLSGVYGPLRPPTQARVPLWLALNLKKRRKCHIVCPEWLHIDNLRTLLRSEQSNAAFASVPPFYQAIAKVLLESAADDVPAADDVREALKSLREARQSKVLAGLEMINADHLEVRSAA